ncbi:hypothetical protein LWI29_024009 [Acer saccharum]|uniref:Uncharacterized protein n=1 Tax=Acer saccharum TaxID=4024 RepID=A0AA39THD6_ACESA|nr:hypothetical protein LWI29_024009 [Acer saccharum]
MITLGSPCKRHEVLVRVGVTRIAKQEVLPRVGMTRIGKQGVMARVGRTRIVMHGRLPRGKSALDRELAIVLVGLGVWLDIDSDKAGFESKVMTLEENSTYKDMKPSEVIGRHLAYESRKGPTSTPPKKQKGIALKTSKVEKEENYDSDEEMALLMIRFKKFYKSEKKGFGSKGQDCREKYGQRSGSETKKRFSIV